MPVLPRITKKDITAYLGVTRETLSRLYAEQKIIKHFLQVKRLS